MSNYVIQSINKVQKVIYKNLKPQRDYINIINEIHSVYRKLHNLKTTPSHELYIIYMKVLFIYIYFYENNDLYFCKVPLLLEAVLILVFIVTSLYYFLNMKYHISISYYHIYLFILTYIPKIKIILPTQYVTENVDLLCNINSNASEKLTLHRNCQMLKTDKILQAAMSIYCKMLIGNLLLTINKCEVLNFTQRIDYIYNGR